MSQLKIGDTAPDFTLQTNNGGTVTLSDLRGQNVIVYFYPKDDTPGCTTEACKFNENLKAFSAQNTIVIGISKDDVKSHDKFAGKYGLNITLAADVDGKTCEAYGAWVQKSMYGKKYMGIDRVTFWVDVDGKIAAHWPQVKVNDHAAEVMEAIKAAQAKAA
ncbi:MAG: thioredoxin-dependent thiol peroxidase [Pseudomonadota bacterium]